MNETALIAPDNDRYHYENDLLVHILEVPAFYITAFWLDNTENSVVIASLPNGLRVLECSMLYSSQDFLEGLRQEQRIIGIP